MGALSSKKKPSSFDGEEVNFDHFQVLRAIGKGSFGKVCIVQKRDTKTMYAMKYMNKAQCEAREALTNVFREVEILASLRHPFLVNLWFSFQDEEDMFMVVDLLLGGDLRYHVQQGVTFTDTAVRLYIMEVASALHYLHQRSIIHRDIKPDNLLLDEEGHVHLTDFNIATVLRPDQLATSMSGTKPYMAPEVFECAADACDGYGFPVDWWSLGVTAYEVRRGKRPFDIHSNTSLHDIRLMLLSHPKYPGDCHPGLVTLISKLLTVSPEQRINSLEEVLAVPYTASMCLGKLLAKTYTPPFTPPKDHLNCDPTFELEEMIIESRPLHKKKKRLSKQKSIRETQSQLSATTEGEGVVYEGMLEYNREREEERQAREKKEQEWQEELEASMRSSDPTGQGCSFSGSQTGTPVRHRDPSRDLSYSPPQPRSPQLPKIAVSPSNVRARIAGSPKVKVRGSTVTIESPRSSSSLTKTSTHHLKERLRELKADQRRQGGSGSDSEFSDLTQSDDLTITGRITPTRQAMARSPSKSPKDRSPGRSPSLTPKLARRRSGETEGENIEENGGGGEMEGRGVPGEGVEASKEDIRASSEEKRIRERDKSEELVGGEETQEEEQKLSRKSTPVMCAPSQSLATVPAENQRNAAGLSTSTSTTGVCEGHARRSSDSTGSRPHTHTVVPSSSSSPAVPTAQGKGPPPRAASRKSLTNGSVRPQVFRTDADIKFDLDRCSSPAVSPGRRHSTEQRRSPTTARKRIAEAGRSSSVTWRWDTEQHKAMELRKSLSVSRGGGGKEGPEGLIVVKGAVQ